VATASVVIAACGTSGPPNAFSAPPDSGAQSESGGGGGDDDGGAFPMFPDSGGVTHDASFVPPVPVVYAHSATQLYKLDPQTKQVSVVGTFGGCTDVIDIALDVASNAYVTTSSGFYKVNLQTAACTHIATGAYPNSLSFVPKGTLDPNAEALVGYFGSSYVRIDPATGAVTTIGALTGGYTSSGDIVSVIGGGTFLTVKDASGACNDCLLQVDPKTGDLVQSYGSVSHLDVFGLAFWAGTVYGFDDAGKIFAISWQNGALVTTDIPVPSPPAGLQFWGAGSTTSAPPTDTDGGGIPLK
jgi:hypothetical protein